MTTPGYAEPDRFRAETLPDLLGPHTRLLFVGVNPGLSAVAVQAPFPRRGNRFYPALFKAGITDRLIDASAGFAPGDREYLTDRGIGITALVSRATARAAELSAAELRAGARDLLTTVTRVKPHDAVRYAPEMLRVLGISQAEALRMITSKAAGVLGLGNRKGRVAPGFDADILAVDGDPLADPDALHRIRAVCARGAFAFPPATRLGP